MGRKYVRKPGIKARNYVYPQLHSAIEAIQSGKLTVTAAAQAFNIPKSTLHDRYKNKNKKARPGRKTALSEETEKIIAKILLQTSLWGFPQTTQHLIHFVKDFLTRRDMKILQFKDGVEPGDAWVKGFLERHHNEQSEKFVSDMRRAHAQVSGEILDSYFEKLEKSLDGLSPNAIFNYVESNLSDGPGKNEIVSKRGVKYPDRVANHSKSSLTLMFCATGDGTVLPPYVVYKAKTVHPSWKVHTLKS